MAYKLLYSLAAVGLVGLIGRSESATTNKICLPPFKKVKKQQMDCVLDKVCKTAVSLIIE
uniref:Venom peptide n=1 Tax=Ascaris lumbricoides TaxID=6252 RepID=A0A0M3HFP8_ASCLU